jgi:hypothetical protein
LQLLSNEGHWVVTFAVLFAHCKLLGWVRSLSNAGIEWGEYAANM